MAKVNFTRARIEAFVCPSGKNQDFIWDTGVPGLGLRVTATNSKAYIFQSRLNGKSLRMTIGDPATWRLPQARDKACRLKILVDSGKDPRKIEADEQAASIEVLKLEAIERSKQTLIARVAWDAYLIAPHPNWGAQHKNDHVIASNEGGSDCKIGNMKAKSAPLASLLRMPLYSITASVIEAWLLVEMKSRPTFTHNAYRKFRTFINWCSTHQEYKEIVHADCCLANTVKSILPKNKTKQDDSLQREQLCSWFAAVKQISNPVFSAYLRGLLITGARRNELAQLKWKDVDFEWSSITIGDKVEEKRTIPLTPYLSRIIASLPRYNEWVFSSLSAKSGHIEAPTKAHKQALDAAGLPHISIHGLRRSFSTLAQWVDVSTGVVAQIMGHKPSAIAEKHYMRRPIDMLRESHIKIENWILEQANEATLY